LLLRAHGERPQHCRSRNQSDEIAPSHSPFPKAWDYANPAVRLREVKQEIGFGGMDFEAQAALSTSAMGPERDIHSSFDHLVGALLKLQGHVEPQRLGGLQVDH
jgi:hypothetical protein